MTAEYAARVVDVFGTVAVLPNVVMRVLVVNRLGQAVVVELKP